MVVELVNDVLQNVVIRHEAESAKDDDDWNFLFDVRQYGHDLLPKCGFTVGLKRAQWRERCTLAFVYAIHLYKLFNTNRINRYLLPVTSHHVHPHRTRRSIRVLHDGTDFRLVRIFGFFLLEHVDFNKYYRFAVLQSMKVLFFL